MVYAAKLTTTSPQPTTTTTTTTTTTSPTPTQSALWKLRKSKSFAAMKKAKIDASSARKEKRNQNKSLSADEDLALRGLLMMKPPDKKDGKPSKQQQQQQQQESAPMLVSSSSESSSLQSLNDMMSASVDATHALHASRPALQRHATSAAVAAALDLEFNHRMQISNSPAAAAAAAAALSVSPAARSLLFPRMTMMLRPDGPLSIPPTTTTTTSVLPTLRHHHHHQHNRHRQHHPRTTSFLTHTPRASSSVRRSNTTASNTLLNVPTPMKIPNQTKTTTIHPPRPKPRSTPTMTTNVTPKPRVRPPKEVGPVSARENLEMQSDDDKYRVLLTMAIGVLSDTPGFAELYCRNKYRPVRKHLLAEADRRFLSLKLKKVGVWNWKPTTRWNMKQIRKWLEQHPLKDPEEVNFLENEYTNLQEIVASEGNQEDNDRSNSSSPVQEATEDCDAAKDTQDADEQNKTTEPVAMEVTCD